MTFLDNPGTTIHVDDDVLSLRLSASSPLLPKTIAFVLGLDGVTEVVIRKGVDGGQHTIRGFLDPGVSRPSIMNQLADWSTEHEAGLIGPSGRLLSTHKASSQQQVDM